MKVNRPQPRLTAGALAVLATSPYLAQAFSPSTPASRSIGCQQLASARFANRLRPLRSLREPEAGRQDEAPKAKPKATRGTSKGSRRA
mmetsp:Transcript_15478/g.36145  ORF Transcript_15478/g.36145 Transcript_15478/m.36145 type:complete len:88 (-) Transcript_15478:850-1113(-)